MRQLSYKPSIKHNIAVKYTFVSAEKQFYNKELKEKQKNEHLTRPLPKKEAPQKKGAV